MDALTKLRRGYVPGRYGQVHYAEAGVALRGAGPSLVCLHATAYSTRSLGRLIAALGRGRHVVGIDTPGFGGSDGPEVPVSIEDYAAALIETLDAVGLDGAADLFGYHTGLTIGLAAAHAAPGRVGRIIGIGVPLFTGEDHPAWRARLAVRHELLAGLDQFAERWRYLVDGRPEGMSLRTGFDNFVDELRAWPNGWWAHDALFRHDLAAILPAIAQDTLIINPASPLAPMSRKAAGLMPRARISERPDLSGAIFERHVPELVGEIEAFLEPAHPAHPPANLEGLRT